MLRHAYLITVRLDLRSKCTCSSHPCGHSRLLSSVSWIGGLETLHTHEGEDDRGALSRGSVMSGDVSGAYLIADSLGL